MSKQQQPNNQRVVEAQQLNLEKIHDVGLQTNFESAQSFFKPTLASPRDTQMLRSEPELTERTPEARIKPKMLMKTEEKVLPIIGYSMKKVVGIHPSSPEVSETYRQSALMTSGNNTVSSQMMVHDSGFNVLDTDKK